MVTLANALLNPGQEWTTYLTVEGIGDTAGLWRFCSRVPYCVEGNAQWRPWFVTHPKLLSERVDPLGGLPEVGELDVTILDVGRALTSQFRFFARAASALASDIGPTNTFFTLESSGASAPVGLAYIGNECINITAKSDIQTVTACERGFLDTDPWSHRARDSVYVNSFYYKGRRVRLYLIPQNADSLDESYEIGVYHCTDFDLDPTLNGYTLRANSSLNWLSRQVPRNTAEFTLTQTGINPDWIYLSAHPSPDLHPWPDGYRVMKVGTDLLLIEPMFPAGFGVYEFGWFVRERIPLGSTNGQANELQPGQNGQFVLCADPSVGAFRRSTSGSTSRSSGWEITTNPIDILLCILTSSNHADDGLELVNYTSGETNYSGLPVGWGLGIPISRIDQASFESVRARFADLEYRDFYFGAKPESFAKLLVDAFLRPLGAYVTTANGQLKLIVPRIPADGGSATDLDADQLLTRPAPFGQPMGFIDPAIKSSVDNSFVISSVSYMARNRDGSVRTFSIDSSEYGETTGQRGYYGTAEKPLEIEFSAFSAPRSGVPPQIRDLMYRRLFRFQRPLLKLTFTTRLRHIRLGPGDIVTLTLDELPDPRLGLRGWSDVRCEIIEKTPIVDGDGARIDWTVVTYGPNARVGWICPAGRVASVASTVATIYANHYTQGNAPQVPNPLPRTDAEAFLVGDVLSLVNLDGSFASTLAATITDISGNDITLSGDFGGNLATNTVLVFGGYPTGSSDANILKRRRFAFMSDRATRTPGLTSHEPYLYGES